MATLMRRSELAAALTSAGFPISKYTLDTLASRPGKAGGPPYRIFGRTSLYDLDEALDWAEARMSAPRRHTSETDVR